MDVSDPERLGCPWDSKMTMYTPGGKCQQYGATGHRRSAGGPGQGRTRRGGVAADRAGQGGVAHDATPVVVVIGVVVLTKS